jgi:hypothetical protein
VVVCQKQSDQGRQSESLTYSSMASW